MLRHIIGQGNQSPGDGGPGVPKSAILVPFVILGPVVIAWVATLWLLGHEKLGTTATGFITAVIVVLAVWLGSGIAKSSSLPSNPSGRSCEERLKELDSLRTKGLITEQEFLTKKQEILSSL